MQIQFGAKILKQLSKRGWTKESVMEIIQKPAHTAQTQDKRYKHDGTRENAPATIYYSGEGHYVIRNDLTGDIVQVSDTNDPGWVDPFGISDGGVM